MADHNTCASAAQPESGGSGSRFYMFDVVVRCRETVSDTELVYDIAHFPSRAILLRLAHSCEKMTTHFLCSRARRRWANSPAPDLPVVGNQTQGSSSVDEVNPVYSSS